MFEWFKALLWRNKRRHARRRYERVQLTDEQVATIVKLRSVGYSLQHIADELGIPKTAVYRVVRMSMVQNKRPEETTVTDVVKQLRVLLAQYRALQEVVETLKAEKDVETSGLERILQSVGTAIALGLERAVQQQMGAVQQIPPVSAAPVPPVASTPPPTPVAPVASTPPPTPVSPETDLPAYLLHLFQTEPPAAAAQHLHQLAQKYPNFSQAINLLGQLTPHILDDYLAQLARMGPSAEQLATWLRANRQYAIELINHFKAAS